MTLTEDRISLQSYQIAFSADAWELLADLLEQKHYSKIAVLVDENTQRDCLPILKQYLKPPFSVIEIQSGEIHKTLETCQHIWEQLFQIQTDRKGVLICLGGGVIGDMGGFCASTFKRGIDFIQIPTTLLSQVDSSIGSKLGIDFNELKNSIGIFRDPQAVLIDPQFLHTLPKRQIASGMAEVIKHALIADRDLWQKLQQIGQWTPKEIAPILRQAIEVKNRIVSIDPFEKADRKALNFGHTIGHAIESNALNTEYHLFHGEAIVLGMIAESYLSLTYGTLSQQSFQDIIQYFKTHYKLPLPPTPHHTLLSYMRNDKKNEGDEINCTLLADVGSYQINFPATEDQVIGTLQYLYA